MGILNTVANLLNGSAVEERSGMSSSLVPPSRNAENKNTVSVGEALTLPAVYRAMSVLTTTVKQMSLDVVKDDKVVKSPSLITQPNPMSSRATFIEQTMISLASNGNAYWEIKRDSTGAVIALTPLNPLDMSVETDINGNIIKYVYSGKDLAVSAVKHLRLFQPPGSIYGLGPIQAAAQTIRGNLDLRDYSTQWFNKGGVPSGVLKTDQFVSDEQVASAKEAWNATAGAKNGVAVLGNNWNYTHIYLKPEDLQFIQNQAFSITEVARLFGIPATLMLAAVEGSSMTYANVSQEWLAFIRFTVMQYLIVIEDALTDFVFGRTKVKFNIETILRADTATRYDSYKVGIEAGWLKKNEVRIIEDLPPIEGLDDVAQAAPVAPAVMPVDMPSDPTQGATI